MQASVLSISMPFNRAAELASLLQSGVLRPVQSPQKLLTFLLSQPGMNEEYIKERVQTIFINGLPADSLDQVLDFGTVVALSAAMPGLAGAIFRRGSIHASLRSRPDKKNNKCIHADIAKTPWIRLKLFNTVARDLAGPFFVQGALLPAKIVQQFAVRTPNFCSHEQPCRFEEKQVDAETLLRLLEKEENVLVRLEPIIAKL